jgi:hypothetical protein
MQQESENNKTEVTKDEQLKLLNKFLVNNPELEELSAKLSIFNILKVLRIEKAEIRHSNVLAWLMDPQGSHGMGQAFIRRFLSTILNENESLEIKLAPAHIELMNVIDAEVLREWKNIDLLVISNSNKWVLLIENKIRAGVSKQQLRKYIEIVKKEFSGYEIIPVLLTLEQDDGSEVAEDSGYIAYSHTELYKIANHVIRQRQDRIPEDAKVFIDHYLTVLRRLTMQDEKIVQLCKTIYRKHKEAIDLIMEWGVTTQFGAAVDDFIMEKKDLVKLGARARLFWFIHKNWKKNMPPCSDRWRHLDKPYPVACWFVFRPGSSKIGFVIEVGSMEESEKRIKLIKSFQNAGFKIGKMGLRPEAKYTRVYSIYRKIENPDDQDEIKKQLEEIWKKSAQALNSTGEVIDSFNW